MSLFRVGTAFRYRGDDLTSKPKCVLNSWLKNTGLVCARNNTSSNV